MRHLRILACFMLLVLSGCGTSFESIEVDPAFFADTPAAQTPAVKPVKPVQPWYTDYTAAMSAAKSQNRPLVIVLHRQSCNPCKELLYGTMRDPAVAQHLRDNFVVAALDVDKAETRVVVGLAQSQRVVVPTLVRIDNGRITFWQIGLMDAPTMLNWLKGTTRAQASKQATQLPAMIPQQPVTVRSGVG